MFAKFTSFFKLGRVEKERRESMTNKFEPSTHQCTMKDENGLSGGCCFTVVLHPMCPQNRALHIPLKVSIMCCKVNDILLC
jgi:hypothetical protein